MEDRELDSEIINIVLTFLIVVGVGAQAWFVYVQAQSLKRAEKVAEDARASAREQERLAREREKPALRFGIYTHGTGTLTAGEPSGVAERSSDIGFTVTNVGYVDVIVTQIVLERGVPSDGMDDGDPTEIVPTPVAETSGSDKKPLTTMNLPHRLRRGESFRVVYPDSTLRSWNSLGNQKTPSRLRPCCMDSLGNKLRGDAWVSWSTSPPCTTAHGEPDSGRVSPEEWDRERREGRRPHWRRELW